MTGTTIDLYRFNFASVLRFDTLRFIMWKTLIAFEQALSMCRFHFKSFEIVKPKSDWTDTICISSSPNFSCFWLLPISIWLHLSMLKGNLFSLVHSSSTSRSFCAKFWEKPTLKSLASSANNKGIMCSHFPGRSLMKIRNSSGLRILPWGTPLVTEISFDSSFAILTLCERP